MFSDPGIIGEISRFLVCLVCVMTGYAMCRVEQGDPYSVGYTLASVFLLGAGFVAGRLFERGW